MLAGHVGVDVLGSHAGLTRDQVAKTGGVEHRSGSEDLITGQARDLQRSVCDNVDRVRDEHKVSVGSDVLQVRHDLLHQVDGRASQLQAGLSGLLLRASRDDDQVGTAYDLNVVRASIEPAGVNWMPWAMSRASASTLALLMS